MNKPLVSVIMPVYNGEKYIRKAVESVYEQGVSLELLVIDDGSTDQVLSAYEGREDFRYIKNEQNMGAAGSRNRGVGLAQGTYIAFLDADDWWESGKLKEQLKRLEETGYVLFYRAGTDESGRKQYRTDNPCKREDHLQRTSET